MFNKTKAQRKQWWKQLSPEEKEKFLAKKFAEKEKLRQEKVEAESKFSGVCDCNSCFLHIEDCDGLSDLTKHCSYWYNPKSNLIGMAYMNQQEVSI
jgi:hypothetical protein